MKTDKKTRVVTLGSARRLTRTNFSGDLPEVDTQIMFRKIAG